MRPKEIVKEGRVDSRPCLFSGSANPSDVCQVYLVTLALLLHMLFVVYLNLIF